MVEEGHIIINDSGYKCIKVNGHPRAHLGYVREHVFRAEKAIGRLIPKEIPVHHFPDKYHHQLVICQDKLYHALLHRRHRAFKACGHASWQKCEFCKQWDSPKNLYIPTNRLRRAWHIECLHKYNLENGKKYSEKYANKRRVNKFLFSNP